MLGVFAAARDVTNQKPDDRKSLSSGLPHPAQKRPISGTSRAECPPPPQGRALTPPYPWAKVNGQSASSEEASIVCLSDDNETFT